MSTVALATILALMLTGLWPSLTPDAKSWLTRKAATPQARATDPLPPAQVLSLSLPVPIDNSAPQLPDGSYLALDAATGTVLYAQGASTRRPIASVTKMVTAMVIMSRHNLDEVITIPELPQYHPDAELIGLIPGERYSIAALLQALLIKSGNDAADALAIADAGSIPKFAARMNALLATWGVTDARFVSPSGLVDTGNYASAEALGKLARLFLTNAYLRQVVATTTGSITSETGRTTIVTNTNQLLPGGNFYGIKTGYTLAAGECFVGLTRINGHEVITIVLGTPDRFGTTQTLANWITTHWTWH